MSFESINLCSVITCNLNDVIFNVRGNGNWNGLISKEELLFDIDTKLIPVSLIGSLQFVHSLFSVRGGSNNFLSAILNCGETVYGSGLLKFPIPESAVSIFFKIYRVRGTQYLYQELKGSVSESTGMLDSFMVRTDLTQDCSKVLKLSNFYSAKYDTDSIISANFEMDLVIPSSYTSSSYSINSICRDIGFRNKSMRMVSRVTATD